MSKGIITTQKVKVCSFTGDPGCLGYPAWIDHPACDCIYEEVDFQFCDCGGNDVYGEMWHEEDCPAVEHHLHPTSGILRGLLGRFWLRVLSALKHFTSPPTCG